MKISRRRFSASLGATALGAGIASPAIAQAAPIVIKFSHVAAADTPKGKGSLMFKELAEKYTAGKVKVDVYHNSSLYKDKEEVDALQLGAVQMLAPSTAKFAPLGAKEFEALDLPFVFKDDAAYARITKGEVGQFLLNKLPKTGLTGLAFWDNGFHMVSANRPLLEPADFQGLKLRISGSKVAGEYLRRMGAVPQIMAFSEVYQALQTGVVDGAENTPSNYLTQKFYEVQKHITLSSHGHLQYTVIVNTKFWDGLPPDIRVQLDKAMAEATEITNSSARKENDDALAEMKKSGKCEFHTLTPAQSKTWEETMKPTYGWAAGRVGNEIIDLMEKARNA